jgi:hypothetical protein
MVLGADRLYVNNLSVDLSKAIQQATNIGDDRLHAGSMPFTPLELHIDNDQARRLRM